MADIENSLPSVEDGAILKTTKPGDVTNFPKTGDITCTIHYEAYSEAEIRNNSTRVDAAIRCFNFDLVLDKLLMVWKLQCQK